MTKISTSGSKSSLHFPSTTTSTPTSTLPSTLKTSTTTSTNQNPLLATVKENFKAQRPDQLNAAKGEALVIMAHSQAEWLVGKPIGRLGAPGLIPLTFVQVKQISSGISLTTPQLQHLIANGGIPSIDDWKAATAAYMQNSIPLGLFNFHPIANLNINIKRSPAVSFSSLKACRALRTSKSLQLLSSSKLSSQHPPPPPPPLISIRHHIPLLPTTFTSSPPAVSSRHLPITPHDPEPPKYATVDELRERYGILVHASVQSFHQEKGQFWFHLRSHFRTPHGINTALVLYRLYDQFFEFNTSLTAIFSDIPQLPKPIPKIDQWVCARWVQKLSDYLFEISSSSNHDLKTCDTVYEFLGPREDDVQLTRNHHSPSHSFDPSSTPTSPESTHLEESQVGTGHDDAGHSTASSSSSISSINSSNFNLPLITHTTSTSNASQTSPSTDYGLSSTYYASRLWKSKDALPHSSPTQNHSPLFFLPDQLARTTQSSEPPTLFSGPFQAHPPTFYRIKLYQRHSDDVFAIRVPPTIEYSQLLAKVRERLSGSPACAKLLIAREEGTLLTNDEDVKSWLLSSRRLWLIYNDDSSSPINHQVSSSSL